MKVERFQLAREYQSGSLLWMFPRRVHAGLNFSPACLTSLQVKLHWYWNVSLDALTNLIHWLLPPWSIGRQELKNNAVYIHSMHQLQMPGCLLRAFHCLRVWWINLNQFFQLLKTGLEWVWEEPVLGPAHELVGLLGQTESQDLERVSFLFTKFLRVLTVWGRIRARWAK